MIIYSYINTKHFNKDKEAEETQWDQMGLNAEISMAMYFSTHKQSFWTFLDVLNQIIRVKHTTREIKSQLSVLFLKHQILCFWKYHCSKYHFESKI